MRARRIMVIVLGMLLHFTEGHSQEIRPQGIQLTQEQMSALAERLASTIKQNEELKATEKKKQAEDEAKKQFLGFNVGAGLMAGIDVGGRQRVQRARVVNGLVRIEEASSAQIGVIAETHRLFAGAETDPQWGVGPFVGLVLSGDNNIIDAAAAGILFGFRPRTVDSESLNIGVGALIFPKAQVLGSGMQEGQPLPAGETEIRYEQTTKYGVSIVVSFGF